LYQGAAFCRLLKNSLPHGLYQGMASQAAEKVKNSEIGMTQNVSENPKNAHIEFKRDIFSSISKIPTFSAACSAVPLSELLTRDFSP
jgi:hypothetical protein